MKPAELNEAMSLSKMAGQVTLVCRSPLKARREHIYVEQRFSDHAPVIIDYDLKL